MTMVRLRNPDAPASSRQLYRISQLTGESVKELSASQMTMQKASNRIDELEMVQLEKNSKLVIPAGAEPFEETKVTIIEGEQRSGKTCTGVAKIVDPYFNDCVRIYCRDVLGIDCIVKAFDRRNKIAKIKQNGESQLVRIPRNYKLHSPMRIFSNIHLFGLPYVFLPSFRHTLKWLKSGIICNGKLLLDEAHVGINARASMTSIGQEMEKQSFQYAKAMLEVIMITHMARMIDWTARTIPTERLHTAYNKKTKMVTYTRKRKGEKGVREVSYYAPQYFPFFWTNERINA